jgi:myo-inositol-1(or 4)-monophosphatase
MAKSFAREAIGMDVYWRKNNMELAALTEKVRELAVETGAFIRNERKKFSRDKVEKKHAHDYVSYVDKESERRIVSRLKELLPEAGFIAEEGTGSLTDETYCWVVDPLDGTTNFIHDNAPYCVSIALRNREEFLIGVVYEICRDECFWTYKGSPSFLNGNEIHVSAVSDPDDTFLALGFPYNVHDYKPTAIHLVNQCYGRISGLRLLGAAAAELCYVAAGRFDARIEAYLGPWDIAAGSLILLNAGGKITDFKGGNTYVSGHQIVASNGKIHDFLLDIIDKQ